MMSISKSVDQCLYFIDGVNGSVTDIRKGLEIRVEEITEERNAWDAALQDFSDELTSRLNSLMMSIPTDRISSANELVKRVNNFKTLVGNLATRHYGAAKHALLAILSRIEDECRAVAAAPTSAALLASLVARTQEWSNQVSVAVREMEDVWQGRLDCLQETKAHSTSLAAQFARDMSRSVFMQFKLLDHQDGCCRAAFAKKLTPLFLKVKATFNTVEASPFATEDNSDRLSRLRDLLGAIAEELEQASNA